MMKKTCAFTGHRPSAYPFGYDETDPRFLDFQRQLVDTVHAHYAQGYRIFYTGMAEGFDLWAAEVVMASSAVFPDIELRLAIPYKGHRDSIGAQFLERYDRALSHAAETVVLSESYHSGVYKARNYYMAEHADAIIAAYDQCRFRSGTGQTVRRAQALGKPVTFLPVK